MGFAVAATRLFQLQFHRSEELKSYRENRLRQIEQIPPRRGRILDAKGRVLAEDRPSHDLWLIPARSERSGRKRITVSNLPPLTVDQMIGFAKAHGSVRELEENIAAKALAEANPLVKALAERLKQEPEAVARQILAAVADGRPSSPDDLLSPRLAISNLDFPLSQEIRAARANPYANDPFQGVEMRVGGSRVYPEGKLFGHITGTIGRLTPQEYLTLRGQWDADTAVPGKGVITNQGRTFFSIKSPKEFDLSDEETILRLRQVKRNGVLINTAGYLQNDAVGRGGLEQYYNQSLRGRHVLQQRRLERSEIGGKRIFQPVGERKQAQHGVDMRITIDIDFQRKVYEILDKHLKNIAKRPELTSSNWQPTGSIIVMDPDNGRIHALVTLPSYDPNTYSADFKQLLADPANPLLDRTMSGIYPPGSVVKPLVGLSALSEDRITPAQFFTCDKEMFLGGAKFTCLGRHGSLDLEHALMYSCNIFFYHTGGELGGKKLSEWYTRMGLAKKTGIDLAGEGNGLIPRNAFTGRRWALGNTYHLAIGQGMAITPLQLAVAYCGIANANKSGVKIVRPHLLKGPADPDRDEASQALSREAALLDLPKSEFVIDMDSLSVIRDGMWKVVQGDPVTGDYGTGVKASFPAPGGGGYLLEIGGKTGTAEWSKSVNGQPVKQVSHVWFAGYAPFDRPKVVIVVMIPEAGGGGGGTCAPIAKEVLRVWFNLPEETPMQFEEDTLG